MTENELNKKVKALEALEEKLNQRLKEMSPAAPRQKLFRPGNIFKYIIPVLIISSMVILAQDINLPHFFRNGQILDADSLNSNFTTLEDNFNTLQNDVTTLTATVTALNDIITELSSAQVPIGGVIAWHKHFITTPANRVLPAGYVECNGQTLNDPDSMFNNQTIPNLNGNPGGANSPGHNSKVAMFLRGGVSSGTPQEHTFQGHTHASTETISPNPHNHKFQIHKNLIPGGGGFNIVAGDAGIWDTKTRIQHTTLSIVVNVNEPTEMSAHAPLSYGDETRPANMSVVWIMRVK